MTFEEIRLAVWAAKAEKDKEKKGELCTEVRTIIIDPFDQMLWDYLNAFQDYEGYKMSKEALLNFLLQRSERFIRKETAKMEKKLTKKK